MHKALRLWPWLWLWQKNKIQIRSLSQQIIVSLNYSQSIRKVLDHQTAGRSYRRPVVSQYYIKDWLISESTLEFTIDTNHLESSLSVRPWPGEVFQFDAPLRKLTSNHKERKRQLPVITVVRFMLKRSLIKRFWGSDWWNGGRK